MSTDATDSDPGAVDGTPATEAEVRRLRREVARLEAERDRRAGEVDRLEARAEYLAARRDAALEWAEFVGEVARRRRERVAELEAGRRGVLTRLRAWLVG